MLAQPFVYFPFLNFLGDMPFMRVKNLVKAAWWKSRVYLTPEGEVVLTPENVFILTPKEP